MQKVGEEGQMQQKFYCYEVQKYLWRMLNNVLACIDFVLMCEFLFDVLF
jgi:hypothetical protein